MLRNMMEIIPEKQRIVLVVDIETTNNLFICAILCQIEILWI